MTLLRVVLLPVLWLFALYRATGWLGAGLALVALTDVVDGQLARRRHQVTRFGSRLDSIADLLLTLSAAVWLVLLRPEFVRAELPWLAGWGALGLVTLLVGAVKFRRIANLHLYSAKLAMVLGYLFIVWVLLFGTYSGAVFLLVMGVCYLAVAETLLVLLTRDSVDEHLGSILRRP